MDLVSGFWLFGKLLCSFKAKCLIAFAFFFKTEWPISTASLLESLHTVTLGHWVRGLCYHRFDLHRHRSYLLMHIVELRLKPVVRRFMAVLYLIVLSEFASVRTFIVLSLADVGKVPAELPRNAVGKFYWVNWSTKHLTSFVEYSVSEAFVFLNDCSRQFLLFLYFSSQLQYSLLELVTFLLTSLRYSRCYMPIVLSLLHISY